MQATIYGFLVLLSCFQGAFVAAVAFTHDLCPAWYLRESKWYPDRDPTLELVAICSIGNDTSPSHEYRTNILDISACFVNHEGELTSVAVADRVPLPGNFTGSCDGCGLSLQGPHGADKTEWNVVLTCTCKTDNGVKQGEANLEAAIMVNQGMMWCTPGGHGKYLDYSPNANPAMLPVPGNATVTTTATVNNTITSFSTTTANATFFSTATNTAATTIISSCASPSQATITETKKGKTHEKTVTATMTETHPVTVLVSIMVTKTPTPTPTIAAQLHSTVVADFTTING
ncbi:hypothetical protein ABKA04_000321 [Annulohypoxylon sp. FPYF3050]